MSYLSPNLPLPLRDGALFIDNTFLDALTTCARSCEYSQVRRLISTGERAGVNFGTAGHLCLDYRYSTYGPDLDMADAMLCQEGQKEILTNYFSSCPAPEGDWRDLNWAIEMFTKRYNEKYALEPFQLLMQEVDDGKGGKVSKPMVEMPFAIPFALYIPGRPLQRITALPQPDDFIEGSVPIFYCGKIDLPVLWDTLLFILDHKTTSMLGDKTADEYRVSPQQIGYAWAWWKITGNMPIGFCVNFIRTRQQPLKPKGGLAQWWEESFFRLKEYLQPSHYAEWEFNTFALIEEFLWHHGRGYFPMERKHCVGKYGKCQFYEVCYTPFEQRLEVLQSTAFMENVWSPLKEKAI